jgi:hypothetical protein
MEEEEGCSVSVIAAGAVTGILKKFMMVNTFKTMHKSL